MFDAEYYENLRRRVTALLIGIEHLLEPDQVSVLSDLIDHNEPGLAVEMMTAMLADANASLDVEQSTQIEDLVRIMNLDASVSRQARAMVDQL